MSNPTEGMTPQQANEWDAAGEWAADTREPEKYVPVSALLPLLQAWKDWVPSKSPNAQVSAVNNGILQGQEWAHDDLVKAISERAVGSDLIAEETVALRAQVAGLESRLSELRKAFLTACREKQVLSLRLRAAEGELYEGRDSIKSLNRFLDEANDEIRSQREAAQANAQILKGEEANLSAALGYLTKLHDLVREADEDFNLSGSQDPDV